MEQQPEILNLGPLDWISKPLITKPQVPVQYRIMISNRDINLINKLHVTSGQVGHAVSAKNKLVHFKSHLVSSQILVFKKNISEDFHSENSEFTQFMTCLKPSNNTTTPDFIVYQTEQTFTVNCLDCWSTGYNRR